MSSTEEDFAMINLKLTTWNNFWKKYCDRTLPELSVEKAAKINDVVIQSLHLIDHDDIVNFETQMEPQNMYINNEPPNMDGFFDDIINKVGKQNVCLYAVATGDMDLWKYARLTGCVWDEKANIQAIINGYFKCFQYYGGFMAFPVSKLVELIIRTYRGDFDVDRSENNDDPFMQNYNKIPIKRMFNRCRIEEFCAAAQKGDIGLLGRAKEKLPFECHFTWKDIFEVLKQSNVDLIAITAVNGQTACLRFLREQGAPLHQHQAHLAAAHNREVNCVAYILGELEMGHGHMTCSQYVTYCKARAMCRRLGGEKLDDTDYTCKKCCELLNSMEIVVP